MIETPIAPAPGALMATEIAEQPRSPWGAYLLQHRLGELLGKIDPVRLPSA